MGGNADGVAGIASPDIAGAAPPAWDRYAHVTRPMARAVMALLVVLLVLAAWAPGLSAGPKEVPNVNPPPTDVSYGAAPPVVIPGDDFKDNDLRFYRLIIERVKRGDDYYVAATELQRANNYPVAPGLTVRLPTLAYVAAWLGPVPFALLGLALVIAVLFAMLRRFHREPGGAKFSLIALALLFVGLSTAIHPHFNVLHEVWSAQLMALSFALHQPERGKWGGSLAAGAAALAVRELALPFVLLMAAWALWHQRWREGAAWVAVIVVFAVLLNQHVQLAEAQIRPGDAISPSWLTFSGLNGLLYKVIHASNINILPTVIAGPLVILGLFGWTGWRSAMGSFASLLLIGYSLAFAIAGRDNNFYWGVMIIPLLLMGLAMVPFAATSLWQQARGVVRA